MPLSRLRSIAHRSLRFQSTTNRLGCQLPLCAPSRAGASRRAPIDAVVALLHQLEQGVVLAALRTLPPTIVVEFFIFDSVLFCRVASTAINVRRELVPRVLVLLLRRANVDARQSQLVSLGLLVRRSSLDIDSNLIDAATTPSAA